MKMILFSKYGCRGVSVVQYVAVVALSAATIAAMFTTSQRGFQGAIQKAKEYAAGQMSGGDNVTEYEPYYVNNWAHTTAISATKLKINEDNFESRSGSVTTSKFENKVCAEDGTC